jgi:uncharacterized damage-inducible protein DinB
MLKVEVRRPGAWSLHMDPELARLADLFRRVHAGDAWHGPSLRATLDGVTPQMAAARPVANAHSIWEIVLHVAAWRGEVLRRLAGGEAALPEEGDWPEVPEPTEENWRLALDRLQATSEAVVASLGTLSDSHLGATVKNGRDRALGTGMSFYVTLHGLVHHDAYHAGQIALLGKALQRG